MKTFKYLFILAALGVSITSKRITIRKCFVSVRQWYKEIYGPYIPRFAY